jgi:hypothetical protein
LLLSAIMFTPPPSVAMNLTPRYPMNSIQMDTFFVVH